MMNSVYYTVGVNINGNARGLQAAAGNAQQYTRAFGRTVREEFAKIRDVVRSTQGQLASLGLGVGLVQLQKAAAELQKTLKQIQQSAGMSVEEQEKAYKRIFKLVKQNGGVVEETLRGFNSLIQAGMTYQEAMSTIEAVSPAKAVTGASEHVLSGALGVGATSFGMDLSKPGVATQMLDEMTVAARLGNAELENLSDVFSRVAQNSQTAGMSFQTTLAYIESLSRVERQPERLATLADSTLRLFTNADYAKNAQKATGIKFFDKEGGRRDPIAVLEEMRVKYQKLTTDAQRFKFVSDAFGQTDLTTQNGLSALLRGDGIQKIREFEQRIKDAGGTIARDLPQAINNAVDQSSRLKNTLREAAEGFAQPINDAVTKMIQKLLDDKAKGGMALTGEQLIGGSLGAAAGAYAISRFLPAALQKFGGKVGGVGLGVATGKALEQAAGVTPVYVTNWAEIGGTGSLTGVPGGPGVPGAPGGGSGGAPGTPFPWGKMLRGAGVAGSAAFAGYEVFQLFGALQQLSEIKSRKGVADYMTPDTRARLGMDQLPASQALVNAIKNAEFKGEIQLRITSAPGVGVDSTVLYSNPRIPIKSDVGRTGLAAGH